MKAKRRPNSAAPALPVGSLMLTAAKTARQLGTTGSALRQLQAAGQFPPATVLEGRPYWSRQTLVEWLAKQAALATAMLTPATREANRRRDANAPLKGQRMLWEDPDFAPAWPDTTEATDGNR